MSLVFQGELRKMRTELAEVVQYTLLSGDEALPLNEYIGCRIILESSGSIHCLECGRLTKKSFNQGYCYPCFRKLAACDVCIMSPVKCHYAAGTCREPQWAKSHCHVPHIVYLANTSGVKVGITRVNQMPTRWIDQGATQAKPIARVQTRHQSGLLEVLLARQVGDRTAWQAMLKGNNKDQDLEGIREGLVHACGAEIEDLKQLYGSESFQILEDAPEIRIKYPVRNWPEKVKAHNLDKNRFVEGVLMGIKGQYLMMDTGVLNVRKFGGYEVQMSVFE